MKFWRRQGRSGRALSLPEFAYSVGPNGVDDGRGGDDVTPISWTDEHPSRDIHGYYLVFVMLSLATLFAYALDALIGIAAALGGFAVEDSG